MKAEFEVQMELRTLSNQPKLAVPAVFLTSYSSGCSPAIVAILEKEAKVKEDELILDAIDEYERGYCTAECEIMAESDYLFVDQDRYLYRKNVRSPAWDEPHWLWDYKFELDG